MTGPAAVFYGPGDAAWAACLMVDLRARGAALWDATGAGAVARSAVAEQAGMLVVIRSWYGPSVGPTDAEVAAVAGRGGRYVLVRRNRTKIARDDHPGGSSFVNLWDDYYQPARSARGRGSGGFAHLLGLLGGSSTRLDLPRGYVFISYRDRSDRELVRNQLRPCLARAGFPSWDYRLSERVSSDEPKLRLRLEQLVEGAGAVVVVATAGWPGRWTSFEVATARRLGRPVLGVRRARTRPALLDDVRGVTVYPIRPGHPAPRLVAALRRAGVHPLRGDA